MIEKHPDRGAALGGDTFLGQLPPEARDRLRSTAGQIDLVDPDGLAGIVGRRDANGRQGPLDWTTSRTDP